MQCGGRREAVLGRTMDVDDFLSADADGSGDVTEAEYTLYMLGNAMQRHGMQCDTMEQNAVQCPTLEPRRSSSSTRV